MRALTICQPYAHLIMIGHKRVENRRYPPDAFNLKHHPPFDLLIHAGKSRAWLDLGDIPEGEPEISMAFGAIVGVARVVACVGPYVPGVPGQGGCKPEFAWIHQHEHTRGPFCWVLDQVRRFRRPIPYRGRQQIFGVPDDLVADALATAEPIEHP